MSIFRYESEMNACLAKATQMLGQRALPVVLDVTMERALRENLRLEERHGYGSEPALMCLARGGRGHELYVGLERYRWEKDGETIGVVRIAVPPYQRLDDFWAVPAAQYRQLYRRLRLAIRKQTDAAAPIMPEQTRQQLWSNTVGLLRRGRSLFSRYDVRLKRGVLLAGQPGNGKTMACRWLARQCQRHGLAWSTVSAQRYADARDDRAVARLFQLSSPGIVFFDDFDQALSDRAAHGETDRHSTFLTELDGICPKAGVVYLFTTNKELSQLDPAMRRPGRIDVVIRFPHPDSSLRRQLIDQTWHSDIRRALDIARVVTETDGLSFAEMEELRTLLVLQYLESGRWDWAAARRTLDRRAQEQLVTKPIGFRVSAGVGQCAEAATSARA